MSRAATHAGSWYTSNGARLDKELSNNLANVGPISELDYDPPISNAKAIIAPHAGYSYSGPAAAWAYAAIPTSNIKRIFLLGPSHHVYLNGVALSGCKRYETPLGDIPICIETVKELKQTGAFSEMKLSVDEDEHSLEMHLPYIRKVFSDAGNQDVRLVPILVGHPSYTKLQELNRVLTPYWQDPGTFFIISSDFCHWGKRFSCTPYYPKAPHPQHPVPPVPSGKAKDPTITSSTPAPLELIRKFDKPGQAAIWQSIQYMDHEGMDILRDAAEAGTLEKWERYLERTKNTICGRNPITVLLSLLQHVYSGSNDSEQSSQRLAKPKFTFVRYEQSSQCESKDDSSVSYVSGVLRV